MRSLMLSPFRVLDLTDDKGFLCAKILADLGADVIKIEPPGGDLSRNLGPFYQDNPDPEKSLYWWAYNLNKRGITLNIESPDGRDIFKRLVTKAHFVIESFPVGYLDKLGLSFTQLSHINPALVLTSITPFGQSGPYSSYQASDIVGQATSGFMYLTGDPDRPPLRIGFDQAYLHAGAHAAVGSLAAHYHRQATGRGQHVDVSMQQSMLVPAYLGVPFWVTQKVNLQRTGQSRSGLSQNAVQRQTWRCKDGYVTLAIIGGGSGAKTNSALVDWMNKEGMADDFINSINWQTFDTATVSQQTHERIEKAVGRFFLSHTKEELYNGAVRGGIMILPVLSIQDIVKNPQLEARDFWAKIEHPEMNTSIGYPGKWVKVITPVASMKSLRAPLIGEHNSEVYREELGLSTEYLLILKQAGII